jgi:hypothetical protein
MVKDIWRQKPLQKWCKMRYKNTHFFRLSARLRKGCNHINKIEHNRSYLVSLNDIKEGAANFFSGLFAKPKCRRIEI